MKKTLFFRAICLLLAASLLSGGSFDTVKVSRAASCLAPVCRDFSRSVTVPERTGEAFEAVIVSSLRHWGILHGWTVQHSVDIPGGNRTRPDLCFGADPAQMLETGEIIVADIKLSRLPELRYPDTYAQNHYRKFRYHYAALEIEKANRERILQSLTAFLHWISDDDVRIAHNAPELKDWGRIWTVIASRVKSAKSNGGEVDDRLFARCFLGFYERMNDVIETGRLVDSRDGQKLEASELALILKNAIYSYEVRKQVRILHPALLTLPRPNDKMFAGLPDNERKALSAVELNYANIFTEWGHYWRRESARPMLRTLQFFIGMYMNIWDFEGKRGAETDARRIRWSDKADEVTNFPLFRFGMSERLKTMKKWFNPDSDVSPAVALGYVSRGLRVGPRKTKPNTANIISMGRNSHLSYFNETNIRAFAHSAVDMFLRERERLVRGGVKVASLDYLSIMYKVVRRKGIHEMDKKDLGFIISYMIDAWPKGERAPSIKTLVDKAITDVKEDLSNESAFYGHHIIRNAQINKAKHLMRAVGFAILKTEADSERKVSISLRTINIVDSKSSGTIRADDMLRDFCGQFYKHFYQHWQATLLKRFQRKYLDDPAGLVFANVAEARMFLFYVGYLRDLLLNDEIAEVERARKRKRGKESTATGRYLTTFGIQVEGDTGCVRAPVINDDGEYSEVLFKNLGACIRGYDHIIKGMDEEAGKISPVYESFLAHGAEVRGSAELLEDFASSVVLLKARAPKNPVNVMIRDVAISILDECRRTDAAPDARKLGMLTDVMVNLLESRLDTLRGMGYTFKERSSAILREANDRLEKIRYILELIFSVKDPLPKIDALIEKVRYNRQFPVDLKRCLKLVRQKVADSPKHQRAAAVIVLNSYIRDTELDSLDGFLYGYDTRHKALVDRIRVWADEVLNPSMDKAA